jgi:hypothetical protein
MNDPLATSLPVATPDEAAGMRKFVRTSLLLLALFSIPLFKLVTFALHSELYSFIVIVPFISAYLVWTDRAKLYPSGPRLPAVWAWTWFALGAGFLLWAGLLLIQQDPLIQVDRRCACSLFPWAS